MITDLCAIVGAAVALVLVYLLAQSDGALLAACERAGGW